MKKILILFVFILHISCAQEQSSKVQTPSPDYTDITISEFNSGFSEPESNVVILDVRTEQEFEAGAIPNAVQLDFMSPDFKTRASLLDTTKTYVVYCQSGGRSAAASKIMTKELGFKDVKNLEGGYSSWVRSK